MRLILRFALLAVLAGAALGLFLRSVLKRRRLVLLSTVALLPLAAHATYLGVISWRAGAEPGALLGFAAAVLVLLVAGALLARRWLARAPLLTALTPGFVALVYGLLASVFWSLGLEVAGVEPNAVAGAALGLGTLALVSMLLVFVPQWADADHKLR